MTATPTASPASETPTETLTATPTIEGEPLPVELTPDAGAILLRLARAVVAATASGRFGAHDLASVLPPDPPTALLAPAAAFVTLHLDGQLRGCVGCLATDEPLWETVVSAAVSAASRDPRFPAVTEHEVASLSIAVSVLGPALPLGDPSAFRPGLEGIIVERGGRRGLLLPEVATDQGWGAREMLETTCLKAGLSRDSWRAPGSRVLVFRTARVSEAGEADTSG